MFFCVIITIQCFAARIEDEDSDFDDEWMVEERTNRGIVTYPLDPVRYWATPDNVDEDLTTTGGRCMGIQCNIWKRAMRRRHLHHHLCVGGKHNIGYTALQWQTVLRGNCGHLGENSDIALLPRKTAVFLFEFHGSKFNNVALPHLPADRSKIDVHRILKDEQVTCLRNTRSFE